MLNNESQLIKDKSYIPWVEKYRPIIIENIV